MNFKLFAPLPWLSTLVPAFRPADRFLSPERRKRSVQLAFELAFLRVSEKSMLTYKFLEPDKNQAGSFVPIGFMGPAHFPSNLPTKIAIESSLRS